MGAVLPFNAVCKAVANADVSEVTVNRDVPEDVDIGSFVGGLLRMENETKKGGGGRLIDFSLGRSVDKRPLRVAAILIYLKHVIYVQGDTVRPLIRLKCPEQCRKSGLIGTPYQFRNRVSNSDIDIVSFIYFLRNLCVCVCVCDLIFVCNSSWYAFFFLFFLRGIRLEIEC